MRRLVRSLMASRDSSPELMVGACMCTSAPARGARPCPCTLQLCGCSCAASSAAQGAASEKQHEQQKTPADRRATIASLTMTVLCQQTWAVGRRVADCRAVEPMGGACRRKCSIAHAAFRYPSMAEHIFQPAEMLSQLSVVELPTSG